MKLPFKRDVTLYVIAFFIIILIISTIINFNKPLSYNMNTYGDAKVGTPITVHFDVEKSLSKYSPDQFNVELTHKYNSNDVYTFDLTPYRIGQYEFVFTPKYSGKYLVKLTINFDGTQQYFTEEINVAQ